MSDLVIDHFLEVAGQPLALGDSKTIQLSVARLYDFTEMTIPVRAIVGTQPGPKLFLSAALHGDEIIGTEILRRLLELKVLKKIKGALLVVPIVNVFGYNFRSRYLPDRRDLNRCFPGSDEGSMASRVADIFWREVVKKCDYGIDLHSGALHRKNYPQVRALIEDPEVFQLAKAFGAPVILNSNLRDGSLRQCAQEEGILTLLYEAGEALRFDERGVQIGIRGILRFMHEIGMLDELPKGASLENDYDPIVAKNSYWLRAPQSGTFISLKKLGTFVEPDQTVGYVTDSMDLFKQTIKAPQPGVIIGLNQLPLVNRGDALFHLALLKDLSEITERLELINSDLSVPSF